MEDDNDDNNSHANVEIEATADDLIDDKIEEEVSLIKSSKIHFLIKSDMHDSSELLKVFLPRGGT